MSWIVEARVDGNLRRITLGKYELMTLDQARNDGRKVLSRLATNEHLPSIPTLGQVLTRYLEVRSLSKNTLRNYTELTRRCLGDWYELPISSITKDMVLARHRELTRTSHRKQMVSTYSRYGNRRSCLSDLPTQEPAPVPGRQTRECDSQIINTVMEAVTMGKQWSNRLHENLSASQIGED